MTDRSNNKREKENEEMESWFEDLVEHACDLVQCVDGEGRFVYVNLAWLKTMKYSFEEIDNITLWDIIHPDSMEHCMAVFKQVLTGKAYGEVEAIFVAKDGTSVMVEGNVNVKLDKNRQFVHTRGIFRDVTERKQMEAVLQNERAFQGVLLDLAVSFINVPPAEFDRSINEMLREIGEFTNLDRTYLFLHDHLRRVTINTHEWCREGISSGKDMLQEHTFDFFLDFLETWEKGDIVHIPNVVQMPEEHPLRRVLLQQDIQSLLLIPLMQDNVNIGFVGLDAVNECRSFSEQEVALLRVLAEIISNAFTRKKAEEEARALKSFNESIIENITEGIIISDLDGNVTFANPALLNMLGYNAEEFIGSHWTFIVPPQYQNLVEAADARRLEGATDRYELIFKHKDGTQLPFQVSGSPYYNYETGEIEGTLAVLTDISDRKQAEELLNMQNAMLRTQQEVSPDGIFIVDENENIISYNQKFCDIWGLPEEIMAFKHRQKAFDYVLPKLSDPDEFARRIFELYRNRQEKSYEEISLKDGRMLERYSAPMFGDEGQYYGRVWYYRDITERKQAEEALKTSEKKYREILSAMEEGYYEVDLAGNLVFFNESFCRLTGYNNDELIGKSYKQFYKNPGEVFNTFNQVYNTGKSVTAADWLAVNKEGQEAYLELSASLRHDQKGKPIGFRGVIRDITERRQSEERIRYLSFHDQLTGLYNRHFLEEEMKRLDTERQLPISILMADLNGLKLVNDTYGHQTGDQMLKRAAVILKNACRDDDLLARYGGDEFVLYLPRTSEAEARKISDRIEKACRKELVKDVPLSLSTGLAVKLSIEQKRAALLKAAEDNMYQEKLTESRSGKSAIVNTLLKTLAAKSFETETHTRNMQGVAQKIGEQLGLPDSELRRLNLLITLHDIGKINIPEELLNKKEALNDSEWEIMRKHCETGFRIARATDDFGHVADDILAHHERWDGSGYPQGLKGEAIPLLARITAIADAYEVMSNGRPYKKAMSKGEIVAELKRCAGNQFDPKLVEVFLLILQANEPE